MSHLHLSPEPPLSKLVPTVLSVLVCFLTFLFIMLFIYVPNRGPAVGTPVVEERMAKLNTTNAKQTQLISSYEWIDESAKIARIPVARAMEIMVTQLNQPPLQ